MLKYVKTGVLINTRTFSSLRVRQKPRFISQSENILSCGGLSPRPRNISTFESLHLKVISLPAVHYIEDSLAYIHDTTGEHELFVPSSPSPSLAFVSSLADDDVSV